MKGKVLVSALFASTVLGCSSPTESQSSIDTIDSIPSIDSQPSQEESLIILEPKIEFPRNKPKINQVVSEPRFEVKSTPKPVVKEPVTTKKPTGKSVSGVASWYCKTGTSICTRGYPGGLYAAIRSDLLFLSGKVISVCSSKCIHVTIIDCNCGPHANLIDLYSDAFKLLAPLGAGRIPVTIHW